MSDMIEALLEKIEERQRSIMRSEYQSDQYEFTALANVKEMIEDFRESWSTQINADSMQGSALDCVRRQQAIDAVNAATVITNPEHFKGHEKFTGFMEDEDISSFGKWERANGFNTALVETRILLGKLPSAQQTCCGYDIKKLVAFAIACQRAGVNEKDLKEFAQNCEFAWETMEKEFDRMLRETLGKFGQELPQEIKTNERPINADS